MNFGHFVLDVGFLHKDVGHSSLGKPRNRIQTVQLHRTLRCGGKSRNFRQGERQIFVALSRPW